MIYSLIVFQNKQNKQVFSLRYGFYASYTRVTLNYDQISNEHCIITEALCLLKEIR